MVSAKDFGKSKR